MDWRTLITIGFSLYLTGMVLPGGKQKRIPLETNKFQTVLLIFLMTGIVISSYDLLDAPPVTTTFSSWLLTYLSNRWVAFFLAILIKTFLAYWITYFVSAIFNQEKIVKTAAKIFGIEFSQELSTEDVIKAQRGYERLNEQLETLTALNEEIAGYLSSAFEQEILAESYEQTFANLRAKIKNILLTAYANIDGIKIEVIPAEQNGLYQLEGKLAALVEVTWNKRDIATINQKVGVIAYSMVSGLETIIVIDPRAAEYELTDAEIWSVSAFLAAIVSIIGWALQSSWNRIEI
ncbi:MAG TPA: hypothetical protein VIL83_09005 [Capillibacterium sp.]